MNDHCCACQGCNQPSKHPGMGHGHSGPVTYCALHFCQSTPPDGRDQRIAELVDRFLAWPLPADVCADPCATMPGYPHRTGTTLLTATQAEQMLSHVVGPLLQERDRLAAELASMERRARTYDTANAKLIAERDAARAECEKWREREASICPEDVGFVEYIHALQRANQRLEADLAVARAEVLELRSALADATPNMKRCLEKAGKIERERDRALAVVEAARRFVKHIGAHMDWHPPSDLIKALDAWDQGAKPSGGKGGVNGKV